MHQISKTPSNSPLEGGELRPPPFQGGTEGGKNFTVCQVYKRQILGGKKLLLVA